VLRDRANRIYARPDRVHTVTHDGPHYRISGVHLSEPSPQRTPVIYQAGGSPRGRAFAARHAECVFMSGLPKARTAERVRAIRQQAASQGRDPNDIRFIMMATVVAGPTEAEARDKHEALKRHVDTEGMLALFSGMSGIDLSTYSPDDTVKEVRNPGIRSLLDAMTMADPGKVWRVRDLANFAAQASRECFLVGSPSQVADEMEGWMREAEIDGFNLHRSGEPDHLRDFIDLVVPELQNRGIYRTEYRPGTFREKLFGKGDRLRDDHPASKYRHHRN